MKYNLSILFVGLTLALQCAAIPIGSQFLVRLNSLFPSYLGEPDAEEDRLVQTDVGKTLWIKEREKINLRARGVNFIDVTKSFYNKEPEFATVPDYVYPTEVYYKDEVIPLFTNVSEDNLKENLAKFSSFYTRYYKSDTGRESSTWLKEQVEAIASTNPPLNITVKSFKHDWAQFSVIAKIPGTRSSEDGPIIIISAHQDSTNLFLPSILPAPGADDDGSGTVTNLEAFRVLVESGFKPENTIEFHWYSAEEGGLLGSQDIFRKYSQDKKQVVAMLQQDMTGYTQKTFDNGKPESIGVIFDFVYPKLTAFIKLVVNEYLSIPAVDTKCGYGCSDHASASKFGFPSAFVMESAFEDSSPFIHSTKDTLDRLDFKHMAEHSKLAVSYVYELAFTQKF